MRRPKYSIRVEGYEYVVNRRLDGKSLVLSLGEVATAVSGHGITHEVKLGGPQGAHRVRRGAAGARLGLSKIHIVPRSQGKMCPTAHPQFP